MDDSYYYKYGPKIKYGSKFVSAKVEKNKQTNLRSNIFGKQAEKSQWRWLSLYI